MSKDKVALKDETRKMMNVGGVNVEVDMTGVRIVSSFKVGDPVKVLKKGYDKWTAYPGVIVGYDDFKNLPTIIVAYLEYSKFDYVYINENSEDVELAPASVDAFDVSVEAVLLHLDNEIIKAELEVAKAKNKKDTFKKQFGNFYDFGLIEENEEADDDS